MPPQTEKEVEEKGRKEKGLEEAEVGGGEWRAERLVHQEEERRKTHAHFLSFLYYVCPFEVLY